MQNDKRPIYLRGQRRYVLVTSFPQVGNPNDLYEIRALLEQMRGFLRAVGAKWTAYFYISKGERRS